MSVTFHVFAKNDFVQTVTNQGNGENMVQVFRQAAQSSSTPYYGLRRGTTRPDLDGWFNMRSLNPFNDEDVPPLIRTLALMMDL